MQTNPTNTPESPAAAFEEFVELVRLSPALFSADPARLLVLLQPFLANPHRHGKHASQIAEAYGFALVTQQFRAVPGWASLSWLMTKLGLQKKTMAESQPDLIKKLRDLETALRENIRPGSVSLKLKPIRFLEAATGYGDMSLNRLRLQVQTLVDSTLEDELQATSVEIVAEGQDVIVDEIQPQAGFSTISLKQASGAQATRSATISQKAVLASELSAPGAKVGSTFEASASLQETQATTMSAERSAARVEQYLVARKIGPRAIWRVIANVGPFDAGGAEYSADLLVPSSTLDLRLSVEVRAEWLRSGTSHARHEQVVTLPGTGSWPAISTPSN